MSKREELEARIEALEKKLGIKEEPYWFARLMPSDKTRQIAFYRADPGDVMFFASKIFDSDGNPLVAKIEVIDE